MKRSTGYPFLPLFVFFLLTLASCKDKDDPQPAGRTEYNGKSYVLSQGAIEDWGATSLHGFSLTHYNYGFLFTDGTITYTNDQWDDIEKGTILLYLDLYAAGASGFRTGTFTFVDMDNDAGLSDAQLQTKYKDKFLFSDSALAVDLDGDQDVLDESPVQVIAGTVKVSGTSPNFTVEYDLTVAGGKTLKGSFSTNFRITEG